MGIKLANQAIKRALLNQFARIFRLRNAPVERFFFHRQLKDHRLGNIRQAREQTFNFIDTMKMNNMVKHA